MKRVIIPFLACATLGAAAQNSGNFKVEISYDDAGGRIRRYVSIDENPNGVGNH